MSKPTPAEVARMWELIKDMPESAGLTMEQLAIDMEQANLLKERGRSTRERETITPDGHIIYG